MKKSKIQVIKHILTITLIIFIASCNMQSKQNTFTTEKAVDILQNNMRTQQEWIKVHAAEFLLWSGYFKGVKEEFLKEEQLHGDKSPYRIGIWRVLAQADPEQKELWIDKIRQAYLDENGADRLHAIETLAKLAISAFDESTKVSDVLSVGTLDNFTVYKLWNFAYSSEDNFKIVQDSLLRFSISGNQEFLVGAISAYALKKMGNLDDVSWKLLAESALAETTDTPIRANLLNAAIVTADITAVQSDLYRKVFNVLISLSEKTKDNGAIMSILDALSEKGNKEDLKIIYSIIDEIKDLEDATSADILSSCAYAILKINEK
ncbi:MAG: hypothetical protein M0Q54_08855 [Pigmentiphaga sp.]|nr:hypothetical protein [Pigmentiphaga sp.]